MVLEIDIDEILTTYITADSGTGYLWQMEMMQKKIKSEFYSFSVGYLAEHNPLYLDLYVREYLALMPVV
jgi:ABC-2 type transport system ATP-binding protein